MIGEELKIIFDQDKAYLTNDYAISFDQLDLPKIVKKMKLSYWVVKVLDYLDDEQGIFCEIISYRIGKTEFEQNQKLLFHKLNNIQTIRFRSINTGNLLYSLNNPPENTIRSTSEISNDNTPSPLESFSIKRIIEDSFMIPLKNIRFKDGYVSFDKRFNELNETIEFTIINDDKREEFDAVKN